MDQPQSPDTLEAAPGRLCPYLDAREPALSADSVALVYADSHARARAWRETRPAARLLSGYDRVLTVSPRAPRRGVRAALVVLVDEPPTEVLAELRPAMATTGGMWLPLYWPRRS